MRAATFALAAATLLGGCGPDPSSLGFKDGAAMKAAIKEGYRTNERLMLSRKPAPLPDYSAHGLLNAAATAPEQPPGPQGNATLAQPAPSPAATTTAYTAQEIQEQMRRAMSQGAIKLAPEGPPPHPPR